MIANEHLTHVLPLKVVHDYQVDKWRVLTNGGFRAGYRLLKGVSPPSIEDWGPFALEHDARKLAVKLTKHIEKDWPKKKRQGGRK
jgi:hypothetical protein